MNLSSLREKSAVQEVALSFNVGPGPVSIGLAYFNANAW